MCNFALGARIAWPEKCNSPHLRVPIERKIPMLSADYGFISDPGGALVTILVVSVAPFGVLFATVVPGKGPVPEVVRQLATWIQECGLVHFVYRTDREHSIVDLFHEAVRESGRHGRPMSPEDEDPDDAAAYAPLDPSTQPDMKRTELAVPEHSGTGESESNGGAEGAVQLVEDQARTLRAHLQGRLGCQIECTHPLMHWLVSHAALTLTNCRAGDDGFTPYMRVRGKQTLVRIDECWRKSLEGSGKSLKTSRGGEETTQ